MWKSKKSNLNSSFNRIRNKKGNTNKYTGSREVKEEEKVVEITHLEKIRFLFFT